MRKLWNKRRLSSQQSRFGLLTLFGACLLIYFSYHLVFGARSLLSLNSMNSEQVSLEKEYRAIVVARNDLHAKVVRLRPTSVDADMLQERMGAMLGFYEDDAIILLRDKNSL